MLAELTIRGAFMYPRQVPGELLKMVSAGTLDLKALQAHTFKLDDVEAAITKAATLKGFEYCVLAPETLPT